MFVFVSVLFLAIIGNLRISSWDILASSIDETVSKDEKIRDGDVSWSTCQGLGGCVLVSVGIILNVAEGKTLTFK